MAASPVVNSTVAIVDPTTPSLQVAVTAGGALKVDGSTAGGGAITNLPATVDTNSGNKSASTLRVVVATDQPNLTTALNVSPVAAATGGASFLNIVAGQATTVVKASAGTLYAIVFNGAATATNTTNVYDHASGAGTIIATPDAVGIDQPTTLGFGPAGLAFANGLTVITATANGANMTVVYK